MELYPEALIGYRAWNIDCDGLLHSLTGWYALAHWNSLEALGDYERYSWAPKKHFRAKCRYKNHPVPNQECQCGYHAYYHLNDAYTKNGGLVGGESVFGAIAAKGEVQMHENGWRASEVQILGLAIPTLERERIKERVKVAGQRYKIPLFKNDSALVEHYAQRV